MSVSPSLQTAAVQYWPGKRRTKPMQESRCHVLYLRLCLCHCKRAVAAVYKPQDAIYMLVLIVACLWCCDNYICTLCLDFQPQGTGNCLRTADGAGLCRVRACSLFRSSQIGTYKQNRWHGYRLPAGLGCNELPKQTIRSEVNIAQPCRGQSLLSNVIEVLRQGVIMHKTCRALLILQHSSTSSCVHAITSSPASRNHVKTTCVHADIRNIVRSPQVYMSHRVC